jgi:putative ABC transport system permease protein
VIWFKLAWKNIVRRPNRSGLTMFGVAAAIAVLFSLLSFQRGYQTGLRGELDSLGAQIMIVPKGCPYEAATIVLHGGKWPRYMKEEYLARVKAVPGVAQTAGVIMDAIIDPDSGTSKIFLGVDDDYGRIRPGWNVSGPGFSGDSSDEAILGATVADQEHVRPGDTIQIKMPPELSRAAKTLNLRVAGVLRRTNSQDDGFYFLPRKTLQREFDLQGKLVVILVKVADPSPAGMEKVVGKLRSIEAYMNVFPLTELTRAITDLISNTKVFVLAIVLVAIVVGAIGVLNTILMAVFERTREIGMMKAVGAKRIDVFRLIWVETFLMCLVGGAAGIVLAIAASKGVEAFVRAALPYTPHGTLLSISGTVLAASIGAAVFLGIVAGCYPAWRASSVKPMEAIRTE